MLRTRRDRRSAVAAVEFAVVAPVLVALLLGSWEYGRMIQVGQILANAAREGGRQAAAGTRTTAQVKAYVVNYLQQSGISTTGMPPVEVENETSATRVEMLSDPDKTNTAIQHDLIRVTVKLPAANVRWVTSYFSTTTQLTATARWRCLADQPVATISTTFPD